jgi:uncharacterized protein YggE
LLKGRTRNHPLVLAAAIVASLTVAAPATAPAQTTSEPRSIVVTGVGTARGPNDTAVLDFEVNARGRTATGALANNSKRLAAVIGALLANGVAREDIQTSNVSLRRFSRRVNRRKVVRGFVAVNAVTATIRDVAAAGAAIDAAVRAGATGVEGVEFSSSRVDELYRDALAAAYAVARAKAERLAQASGSTLGAVHTINEGFRAFGQDEFGGEAQGAPRPGTAPPIEPGTAVVEATVIVRFLLQ